MGGALLLVPAAARAGAWPDIVGRTYAKELAKGLANRMVDNKCGAGGGPHGNGGARAPADGYTPLTPQGTTVCLFKAPGYDPLKNLVSVTACGTLPTCWSSLSQIRP